MNQETAPQLSVVIPAYNYGHLLPRALDSVLPQLDAQTELIVVDDGSTDKTPVLMADYLARDARIRSIRQDNAGAAAARNHGVRLARGEFVLLLDADDELMPGALAALHQAIKAHPETGLILGGYVSVFSDGSERQRHPARLTGSARERLRRYLLDKQISICHGASLFRRSLLLERPYAEQFRGGEDIPVFAYMLAAPQPVSIAQPLARIHKHADSLRHTAVRDATYAIALTAEVFAKLPSDCQGLRRRYEAQRFLSLFRAAVLGGHDRLAREHYRHAFSLSPWQALRLSYLRKRIAMVLRRKRK